MSYRLFVIALKPQNFIFLNIAGTSDARSLAELLQCACVLTKLSCIGWCIHERTHPYSIKPHWQQYVSTLSKIISTNLKNCATAWFTLGHFKRFNICPRSSRLIRQTRRSQVVVIKLPELISTHREILTKLGLLFLVSFNLIVILVRIISCYDNQFK